MSAIKTKTRKTTTTSRTLTGEDIAKIESGETETINFITAAGMHEALGLPPPTIRDGSIAVPSPAAVAAWATLDEDARGLCVLLARLAWDKPDTSKAIAEVLR